MQKLLIDDPDIFVANIYDLIVYRQGKPDEVKVRTFFDSSVCETFPVYLRYIKGDKNYQQIKSLDSKKGLLHQVIAANELGEETLEKILECQKIYYDGLLACVETGVADFGFYSYGELGLSLRVSRNVSHKITKGIQRAKENKVKFWEPVEFAEDSKRVLIERPKVEFLPHTKHLYEGYRVFTDRMREQGSHFLRELRRATSKGPEEMQNLFRKESALNYYLKRFCGDIYPERQIQGISEDTGFKGKKADLKLMELMLYSISHSGQNDPFTNLVNFFTPNWDFYYLLENIKIRNKGMRTLNNAEFQDLLKDKGCNIRVFTRTSKIGEAEFPRFKPTGRLILKHKDDYSYFFVESLPTRNEDKTGY